MISTNLQSIHFDVEYSTISSTLHKSTPKSDESNVLDGMHDLTSAMQDMGNMLWGMRMNLLRIDDLGHLVERWRDIDNRFHDIVMISKLAASSMTVLLREYHNVIIPSLSSSEVPVDALQTEVSLLKRNIELRMEKLSSRDQSPMQNLCMDMSELVTTTKLELEKHSDILAADSHLLQNQLSELKAELSQWTTRRKEDVSSLLSSLGAAGIACVGAVSSGGIDVTSIIEAATSVLAAGRSILRLIASSTNCRDYKHGVKAAHRIVGHHEYRKQSLDSVQPSLDAFEETEPSYALRADIIVHLHALLLTELTNTSDELARRAWPSSHPSEPSAPIAHITQIGTVGSLIAMLDLYSKQAMFLDRASIPATPIQPIAPREGFRKRFVKKIRRLSSGHDL